MVLSFLFVLATPMIGPPPNVCPLRPDPEDGDEDNGDTLASASSASSEPAAAWPPVGVTVAEGSDSLLSEFVLPAPPAPSPPVGRPPAVGELPKGLCVPGVCPFCPGFNPSTGPLFKLISNWVRNLKGFSLPVARSIFTGSV